MAPLEFRAIGLNLVQRPAASRPGAGRGKARSRSLGEASMGHVAKIVGLGQSDPLFAQIRVEAQEALKRDPALASFLMTAILNHDHLENAIAHRVAERLAHPDLPGVMIRQEYDDLIARDPAIGIAFRADLIAVADRDP